MGGIFAKNVSQIKYLRLNLEFSDVPLCVHNRSDRPRFRSPDKPRLRVACFVWRGQTRSILQRFFRCVLQALQVAIQLLQTLQGLRFVVGDKA